MKLIPNVTENDARGAVIDTFYAASALQLAAAAVAAVVCAFVPGAGVIAVVLGIMGAALYALARALNLLEARRQRGLEQ